ncbi:MAG: efflux RND transporter periplasmic adaptor subunit [Phycisphaerales bacterium]|nr:efflux RND transporter periplasmic adaptor subunit [Phycisphaerales bacterium]
MNRNLKALIIVLLIVFLVGGGTLFAKSLLQGQSENANESAFYTVEKAALSINLTESGTIKSRDQFIVKSEVEGRTSVIYVIDEGVMVKEGDLLVELDSSTLEDRLVDQQIQVENTEADHVSAKENLEVVRIQSKSNIAKATLDNQFAMEDKGKYLEGEWPKLLMEKETDVTLKQEDFRRATDDFNWSEKLYKEQYLSETEYRADELALKRADLQVALARENLNLLTEYTHVRKLAELDSEIEQKGLTLERVTRESASDIVQAEARLRAYEAELNRQKKKLSKIEDQITKTKMYAPADGMVVYATSSEFSWRGDSQPLDEGQEVYERQELIHLPTADSMMVVVRVQESSLGKVQVGQKVNISIDALPDDRFQGTVTKIAPLPDATSVFMNPDLKVYDTQIMIDGIHPSIRTGMSCKATILIEDYESALSVPIQAVIGRGSETIVYVKNGNDVEPRTVKTGLDNNAMIHILEGVDQGERVMLTPPLAELPKGRRPNSGSSSDKQDNSSKTTQAKPSGRPPGQPTGQAPQRSRAQSGKAP